MREINRNVVKNEMEDLEVRIVHEYDGRKRQYYRGMLDAWKWITGGVGYDVFRKEDEISEKILEMENKLEEVLEKYDGGENSANVGVNEADMRKIKYIEGYMEVLGIFIK